MNEVIKTIFKRRAVRKYKEKAVNKEIIGQLIAAGRMAPSAMNRQPWKFYVVTSKDDISLFSKEIAKVGLVSNHIYLLVHRCNFLVLNRKAST